MNSPFFSIVLPVYKVEKYLNRCIISILDQEEQDFEIILVDDGSPDRCPQMCDEWAAKNPKIKSVHKQNAGLGMARNTGMEHASGQYILFVDSDDTIMPGLLSACRNIIEQHHCDGVFYGYARVTADGEMIHDLTPTAESRLYTEADHIDSELLADFLGRNPRTGESKNLRISVCTCCLRLQMLREHQLAFVSEREFISEDTYFYLTLFKHLKSLYLINQYYYCYYQNEGSLTFSYQPNRYARQRRFYIDSVKLAEKEGLSDVVRERLSVPFIANVMSALKMEVGRSGNEGHRAAFLGMKKICKDPLFGKVIRNYPSGHLPKAWKVFFACVKCRAFLPLYLILYIQFKKKGI